MIEVIYYNLLAIMVLLAAAIPVEAGIIAWRGIHIGDDGAIQIERMIAANVAAGGRVVHVSSDGDDENPGTADAPLRTFGSAFARMRNGEPDVLLLRRGDAFPALGHRPHSGRSPELPRIISAYGIGARPRIESRGNERGIFFQGSGGAPQTSNLVIHGLHFRAVERGESDNPAGIFYLRAGSHIWMEDLVVEGYKDNIVLQDDGGRPANIILRRSLIADAWGIDTHSQGLYAQRVDGLLIEDNLFDHNGWRNADRSDATIFNQTIYIQHNCSNVIVRDNIIANASSHGIQLRCGGLIENNLFVGNPLAVTVSGDVESIVRGNVILDGGDIRPDLPRGWGIEAIRHPEYGNPPAVLIEGNLIARHGSDNPDANARALATNIAEVVTIRDNLIYDWPGADNDPGPFVDPRRRPLISRETRGAAALIAHVREGFIRSDPAGGGELEKRIAQAEKRLEQSEKRQEQMERRFERLREALKDGLEALQ